VARRPEVASREKNPAAAGIRRFFPLSKKSKVKISALVVVVVVVVDFSWVGMELCLLCTYEVSSSVCRSVSIMGGSDPQRG